MDLWPALCPGESSPAQSGRPVAVLRPYGSEDPVSYPFRTDPMGLDDSLPTFSGPSGFSERVDDLAPWPVNRRDAPAGGPLP